MKAVRVANEAISKAKQEIGKTVGSPDLQVEGVAQTAEGNAQQATGMRVSA